MSMVIYFFLTLGYGGSIDRELLKSDTHLMQHVALHPAIIVVGLVSSTISSALGALVGSARVMQALAADELLPPLRIFRQMSSDGEPRVRYVLLLTVKTHSCLTFVVSFISFSLSLFPFYLHLVHID